MYELLTVTLLEAIKEIFLSAIFQSFWNEMLLPKDQVPSAFTGIDFWTPFKSIVLLMMVAFFVFVPYKFPL